MSEYLHSEQFKILLDRVYQHCKAVKAATEEYFKDNPSVKPFIEELFDAIKFYPLDFIKLTSEMTGASLEEVEVFHKSKTENFELRVVDEPVSNKKLPPWCIGAVRTLVLCKYLLYLLSIVLRSYMEFIYYIAWHSFYSHVKSEKFVGEKRRDSILVNFNFK